MARKKLRIGIVGASASYGWSQRSHMPALLALPEYELTAVCTSRLETAEASAKHYGARLAFHDYTEMVQHPDVDVVSVSIPAPFHHFLIMAALEAGKHVFCEWPLGATTAQAEEMAALARAKGVCHMVGLQARCAPALLRIKELLEEGYVGEVLTCNITMSRSGILQRGRERAWAGDRTNGANTLSIATGHCIDALCFFVAEMTELTALVTTQVPVWETSIPGESIEVSAPDTVMVNGILSNGAATSLRVSQVPWHGTGWRMEIYGREGTLVATSPETIQYSHISLRGARRQDNGFQELPIPERLSWVPLEEPGDPAFNVAQMYRRMGEAITNGTGTEPDFDQAVKRHRLLDTIQRSSDQGVKQKVS